MARACSLEAPACAAATRAGQEKCKCVLVEPCPPKAALGIWAGWLQQLQHGWAGIACSGCPPAVGSSWGRAADSLSFPLSAERKSGLLPPILGLDNLSGVEYSQPYYWNIAPNRDATFQTTLWSKRGLNLGGEFRYLESAAPDYRGQIRMDYMMNDPMRDRNRWGYAQTHQGWTQWGEGKLGVNLNLNRVSDDNYWRDFPRSSGSLTQRLLPSDVMMSWLNGNVNTTVRAVKWQTLQDVSAPIIPPYDRMPQLVSRYRAASPLLDFSVEADYTRFEADRALVCSSMSSLSRECLQPNADRAFAVTRLAHPFQLPYATVTPKLSLHTRAYQFDTPLVSQGSRSASVTVPTFSLDAATMFERTALFRGASWTQTLEPRAFFVSTPYRDQSNLPIYDTGRNDFNFATVFTENPFSGQDRIADNQLLTLGLTSRLIHPVSGVEGARFGIAQRLRMKDQRTVLPTEAGPVSERVSDVLMGATVNLNPAWMLDSTFQYNPKTEQSMRSVAGLRYNPTHYRLFSTAYRFQRDVSSEVLDTAWQWPLNDLLGDKGRYQGPGRGRGEDRWYLSLLPLLRRRINTRGTAGGCALHVKKKRKSGKRNNCTYIVIGEKCVENEGGLSRDTAGI